MYRNTVSIIGTDKSYVVLFSREGKKPHLVYGKGNDKAKNLVAAATRGVKLAKGSHVIFRTNNEHIRDLVSFKVIPMGDEQDLVQLIKSKGLKLSVRDELDGHNILMQELIHKKEHKGEEIPVEIKNKGTSQFIDEGIPLDLDQIPGISGDIDISQMEF